VQCSAVQGAATHGSSSRQASAPLDSNAGRWHAGGERDTRQTRHLVAGRQAVRCSLRHMQRSSPSCLLFCWRLQLGLGPAAQGSCEGRSGCPAGPGGKGARLSHTHMLPHLCYDPNVLRQAGGAPLLRSECAEAGRRLGGQVGGQAGGRAGRPGGRQRQAGGRAGGQAGASNLPFALLCAAKRDNDGALCLVPIQPCLHQPRQVSYMLLRFMENWQQLVRHAML
jgi:hypothetical protein